MSSKHGETQDIEQGSVQQEFNFTEDASLSTYPQNSSDSSDEEQKFRGLKYGAHHKIDSPLLKLPIDMVE